MTKCKHYNPANIITLESLKELNQKTWFSCCSCLQDISARTFVMFLPGIEESKGGDVCRLALSGGDSIQTAGWTSGVWRWGRGDHRLAYLWQREHFWRHPARLFHALEGSSWREGTDRTAVEVIVIYSFIYVINFSVQQWLALAGRSLIGI